MNELIYGDISQKLLRKNALKRGGPIPALGSHIRLVQHCKLCNNVFVQLYCTKRCLAVYSLVLFFFSIIWWWIKLCILRGHLSNSWALIMDVLSRPCMPLKVCEVSKCEQQCQLVRGLYMHCRRVRNIWRHTRGVDPGEVAVCAGRVRPNSVSGTTDALRQAATEAAIIAHDISAGHWAALLCPPRRQDAHRDAHQRHAAQRRLLQLAVHARSVAEQHRSGLTDCV